MQRIITFKEFRERFLDFFAEWNLEQHSVKLRFPYHQDKEIAKIYYQWDRTSIFDDYELVDWVIVDYYGADGMGDAFHEPIGFEISVFLKRPRT